MVADFPHKGATNLTPLFLHGAASADMTGWSAVLSALLDGLKDGLLSIPILFLAYLLMELLERSSRLNEGLLRRYSRRAGPALGGLLGIVPQCGISGAAATLFSTGSITVGTMLAVFFATSDEMLPILLSSLTESSGISWKTIVLITLSKAALGILLGYLADLLFGRWFRAQKSIHSFCEREHCDCDEEEGSVFLAALRHTLKIAVMLIAVNFALNLLFHYIGVERLSGTVLNRPVLGELILALFGLIPNWLRFRRRDGVLPERRARPWRPVRRSAVQCRDRPARAAAHEPELEGKRRRRRHPLWLQRAGGHRRHPAGRLKKTEGDCAAAQSPIFTRLFTDAASGAGGRDNRPPAAR